MLAMRVALSGVTTMYDTFEGPAYGSIPLLTHIGIPGKRDV